MQKDKARACESLGFVVNKAEKFLKEQDKNLQVGVFAKKGASWTYDTPSFSFYLPHPQTFSRNSLHLSEEKRIFAARLAALGNLKASFHCAHLHNLCSTKVESLK